MFQRISLDEENRLITLANGGDAVALSKLFDLYKPLLKASCRKFAGSPLYEDLYSIACASFLIAVRRYDTSRGVNFARWASAKVKGDLSTEISRYKRILLRELSPPAGGADARGGEIYPLDFADESDAFAASDAAIMVNSALEVLTDRERGIVLSVAGGDSLLNVATVYGITPQRVGQIYRRSLRRLREVICTGKRDTPRKNRK